MSNLRRGLLFIVTIGLVIGLILVAAVLWDGTALMWNEAKATEPNIVADDAAAKVEFEEAVAELITEYEKSLSDYQAELQSAGDTAYEEKYDEIVAQLDKSWEEMDREVKAEGAAYAEWLNTEYETKILNRQLQLAIVSLSDEEFAQVLEEMESLQAEMEQLRNAKDQELKDKLRDFQLSLEQQEQDLLNEAQETIENELYAAYAQYERELKIALDEEIAFLEENLRRTLANR